MFLFEVFYQLVKGFKQKIESFNGLCERLSIFLLNMAIPFFKKLDLTVFFLMKVQVFMQPLRIIEKLSKRTKSHMASLFGSLAKFT